MKKEERGIREERVKDLYVEQIEAILDRADLELFTSDEVHLLRVFNRVQYNGK